MFCAFEGPPSILRLHGRGEIIEPQYRHFDQLRPMFPDAPPGSVRSIIVVRLTRISDSCGYGVPRYHYAGDRPQLTAWAERKGPSRLRQYQRDKNARSVDGCPGLEWTGQEPDTRSTDAGA
jgi:hypothetical protein